jgi:hypothetical protein
MARSFGGFARAWILALEGDVQARSQGTQRPAGTALPGLTGEAIALRPLLEAAGGKTKP